MKPTLLILICCLLCAGVRAQDDRRPSAPVSAGNPAAPAAGEAPAAEGAVLRLAETLWNVGDVPRKGGDVTHDFRFRNEGTEPLVVLRVKHSNPILVMVCCGAVSLIAKFIAG